MQFVMLQMLCYSAYSEEPKAAGVKSLDVFAALDSLPNTPPFAFEADGSRPISLVRDDSREGRPVVVAFARDATDAQLKKLQQYPELEGLYLECHSRPIGSLKHLQTLKKLRGLKIHGDMLTEDNLKILRERGLLISKEKGPENHRRRPTIRVDGNLLLRVANPIYVLPIHANVTEMSLAEINLTDTGLRQFDGLPESVQTIHLKYGSTSDSMLKALSELQLLHRCDICKKRDQQRPATAADVFSIELFQTKATGVGLQELKVLTGLRRIFLRTEDITDDRLQSLAQIGKLHALQQARSAKDGYPLDALDVARFRLDGRSQLTDAGLSELKVFENLEHLVISGRAFSADGFRSLSCARSLRMLQIQSEELANSVWEPLSQFIKLEHVTIGAPLTCQGISSLSNSPGLKYLNLQGTLVGNAELKEVARLKSLVKLNLMNTLITADGLPELKALPQLEELSVAGTKTTAGTAVSDAWLKPISELPTLKTVWIIGDVSMDGIRQLQAARPMLKIKR